MTDSTFAFRDYILRQIEWSRQTFGPGPRTQGVLNHLKKELKEIEDKPTDTEEWMDVVILAVDGAWRNCPIPDLTDEEIATLIAEVLFSKLLKNEDRDWPDWRLFSQDEAIEHVR